MPRVFRNTTLRARTETQRRLKAKAEAQNWRYLALIIVPQGGGQCKIFEAPAHLLTDERIACLGRHTQHLWGWSNKMNLPLSDEERELLAPLKAQMLSVGNRTSPEQDAIGMFMRHRVTKRYQWTQLVVV